MSIMRIRILRKFAFFCVLFICLMSIVSCSVSSQGIVVDETYAYLLIVNKSPIHIHWPSIDFFSPDEVDVPTGQNKSFPLRALAYQISRNESHLIMSYGIVEKQFPVESFISLSLDNKSIEIGSKFSQVAEAGRLYNLTIYVQ